MSLLEDLMTLRHPDARVRRDQARGTWLRSQSAGQPSPESPLEPPTGVVALATSSADARDPLRSASSSIRARLLELAARSVWEQGSRSVHRIPPGIREDVVQRLLLALLEKLQYSDAHMERAVGRGTRNPTIRALRLTDPEILFAWPRDPAVEAVLPEAERQLEAYLARTLSRFARAYWKERPLEGDEPELPHGPPAPGPGGIPGAVVAAGDGAIRALEAAFACTDKASFDPAWGSRWARLKRVARGASSNQGAVLEELRRTHPGELINLDAKLQRLSSRCDAATRESRAQPDRGQNRSQLLARVCAAATRLEPGELEVAIWALLRDVRDLLDRATSFKGAVGAAAEPELGDPAIAALSTGPAELRGFNPGSAWTHVGGYVEAVHTSRRLVAALRRALLGPEGSRLVPGHKSAQSFADELSPLELALDHETLELALEVHRECERVLSSPRGKTTRYGVDQHHTRLRDRLRRGTRRLAPDEAVTTLRRSLGAAAKRARGSALARVLGALHVWSLEAGPSELRERVADALVARTAEDEAALQALGRVVEQAKPPELPALLARVRAELAGEAARELDAALALLIQLAESLEAADDEAAARLGPLIEHDAFELGDARHVPRPPSSREAIQLGFAAAQRFHPTFSPLFGALARLSVGASPDATRAAHDAIAAWRVQKPAAAREWESLVDGEASTRAELASILKDPAETELRAACVALDSLASELAGGSTPVEVSPIAPISSDELWLARVAIDRVLTPHAKGRPSEGARQGVRHVKKATQGNGRLP